MPSRTRVEELITAVVTGNHAEAIARFYTEDATMQENATPPRQGLPHLVERERKAVEKMAEIVTHPPATVIVEDDRVAIHWVFDFTHQDGRRRRVDEVALQRWRGDKIAEERFVYDSPSAAWKP
jgi:ketosteroid isomerase-like protein